MQLFEQISFLLKDIPCSYNRKKYIWYTQVVVVERTKFCTVWHEESQ